MKTYKYKEEAHNDALKIVDIPFKELEKQIKDKYGITVNVEKKNKNYVGDLFEAYFGKAPDNESAPDLGVVELKATPYKKLKRKSNGSFYSAKERLVLNMIDYFELINENFENSHFLEKAKNMELAFYQYNPDIPRSDWTFSKVVLYEMHKNPVDYAVIKQDWEKIKNYVDEGKADELSEGLTQYLAASTKAKDSKTRRAQPHSDKLAKPRAFSLKTSYMTQLLREYILGEKQTDAIIKDPIELQNKTLLEIIESRLNLYKGKSTAELCKLLNIKSTTAKNFNFTLIRKMLKANNNNEDVNEISELKKASYLIKTIQLDSKGKTTQAMSFPTFSFSDLANETWEESQINQVFGASTFIFTVFEKDTNGNNIFKGSFTYKFTEAQVNGDIKDIWEMAHDAVKDGISLTWKGNHAVNNLPGSGLRKIIHFRPHASNASYVKSNNSDKLLAPADWTNYEEVIKRGLVTKYPEHPEYMTKHCFWINKNYVQKLVDDSNILNS